VVIYELENLILSEKMLQDIEVVIDEKWWAEVVVQDSIMSTPSPPSIATC
jgi:hypothetical protein